MSMLLTPFSSDQAQDPLTENITPSNPDFNHNNSPKCPSSSCFVLHPMHSPYMLQGIASHQYQAGMQFYHMAAGTSQKQTA